MITLIHGENIKDSRNYYFQVKQNSKSQITFDGVNLTITELVQALSGKGLFENEIAVFIENLFSKGKKSKDLEGLLKYLKENEKNAQIVLWEPKKIAARDLNNLGNPVTRLFDFPREIFAFLDSIKPGNFKSAITFFHKTIETEEEEFVFFMIVRHFRILLAIYHNSASHDPQTEIDEVKRLAPWQRGKLEKQANLFGEEKIVNFYNKLFIMEEQLKTGKMSTTLTAGVDFLLSTL